MYVHRSNRMEMLAAALAEIVRVPPDGRVSPLQAEEIVVPGPAMGRWLAGELATRLGVWANPAFPFPRAVIERALRAALGADGEVAEIYTPERLVWAVAKGLSQHRDEPAFADIGHYLRGDDDGRKLLQLADRVAGLFDRYTVYRPELLHGWERGEGGDWQAVLWRALVAEHGGDHTGALAWRLLRGAAPSPGPITDLSSRICLFGISALPPLYVQILTALAEHVEIHLFVLSPSKEYWGDSVGAAAREDGNPLLVSMGRLHRDFQRVLEENATYREVSADLYLAPDPSGSILATIQEDILRLSHRGGPGPDRTLPPVPLAAADRSVSVHSCHGPMRELEVVHDQLMACFEADETLQPRDVVVMAPEIEAYAPLIDAVFGASRDGVESDRPRIPYRVADRADSAERPVMQAFSQLLGLLRGRMTAPEVLDLLAIESVRERFGIAEQDLATIRNWVVTAGVRWGEDEAHRAEVGQPDLRANTWGFGLDRLLLGYAIEGGEREVYQGVLPFDDMEGTGTELLGRLLDFCDALFKYRKLCATDHPVAQWRTLLLELCADVLADDEANAVDLQHLRDSVVDLAEDAAAAGFVLPVALDPLRAMLERRWQTATAARGFLSGGVTFCQLMPMRSIPFRVVCVIGMNDGAFPRSPQPLGFDRIAAEPRVGDRTVRDDDRYLFLESILAARDRLVITYVGQSIKNNVAVPPSVLVGELLDVIEESVVVPDGAATVRERMVVTHPLQPFSPRYFGADDDERLFSYARRSCEGARSLAGDRNPPSELLTAPLPLADDEPGELTVEELAAYFMHPTRALAEQRIGLSLRDRELQVEDREPLLLDQLEDFKVGQALLDRVLAGDSVGAQMPALRAGGVLPLGTVGEHIGEGLSAAVDAVARAASAQMQGEPGDGIVVNRVAAGTRIVGTVDGMWAGARVQASFRKLGRRTDLKHWIEHLLLCWCAPVGSAPTTRVVGRVDRGVGAVMMELAPVAEPEPLVADLVRTYWLGQEVPLPFFPQAARAFAAKLGDADLGDADDVAFGDALGAAHAEFHRKIQGVEIGEAYDAYVAQVFADADPLAPSFRPFADLPDAYASFPQLACRVFRPFLAHAKVVGV